MLSVLGGQLGAFIENRQHTTKKNGDREHLKAAATPPKSQSRQDRFRAYAFARAAHAAFAGAAIAPTLRPILAADMAAGGPFLNASAASELQRY